MSEAEQLQQMREHVLTALKKIPHSRWYACDGAALDSLAFLGVSWLEDRVESGLRFNVEEFQNLIAEVVANVDSLRQVRPEEPPPTPEVWRDKITGEVPRNPWSGPEPDLASQGVLAEREPALAAHLKRIAGGVSYAYLAELRDKEAGRARLASIKYSEAEHRPEVNRYLTDDLAGQAELVRQNPELAEIYKREASTPVRLPWRLGAKNLTSLGKLTAKAPHVAKLAARASELERQKIAEKIASAKANEAEAARERQEAEAQLK